ncbi:SDR family NAD(P)-dependent oxidoreductase [Tautonia sociabilis]|uniref:SDR family oxidoreductase n=1 Tax=Tautonia sociabilis TaxID=2080755 RepID=A0A432MEW9_9BACT|nr:SDR family oxidoreductase [Tautonia sociabilis]RUL84312.1 SDR family oxidoreductase [Tautonia sociabilis]
MPPDLSGLRVAVLGSTSGIGRATARAMARSGADVIVHGRRSREEAEAIAADCLALGSARSAVLMADLADREAGDRLVEEAWATWGGLDAWIQIAGADTLTGEGARLDFDAKLDLLWAVDVAAALRLCRRVGRLMKASGRGIILTMGWDQAETGMEGDSGELFSATKGAVMCFSRSLALSLAPEVRVNCLAPGWIKTSWGEQASDDWQRRAVSETPLARWGTPEDVAEVARFLVGPGSGFLTGQIIRINGGAIR